MQKPRLRLAPEFIEPSNILQMTEEDQAKLLEGIRERRMIVVAAYSQVQEEKKKAKDVKVSIRIDKTCGYIAKELVKLDAVFEKLEQRINELRALRLEIE